MHIIMKHIVIENCHAGLIFPCSTELWNFGNRLGAGLGNDFTYIFKDFSKFWGIDLEQVWGMTLPNSLRILAIGLKFGGMMHSTVKQLLFKMAMLSQFLHVPWNLEIFHDLLGQGLRDDVTTLNSLRIWATDLKFGGVMHWAMKQIAMQNGYARLIFACPW